MDEPRRRDKGDGKNALTGGEAKSEANVSLARPAVAQGDMVVAGDDIFALGEFEDERLVERGHGGKVECVEALGRPIVPSVRRDHRMRGGSSFYRSSAVPSNSARSNSISRSKI